MKIGINKSAKRVLSITLSLVMLLGTLFTANIGVSISAGATTIEEGTIDLLEFGSYLKEMGSTSEWYDTKLADNGETGADWANAIIIDSAEELVYLCKASGNDTIGKYYKVADGLAGFNLANNNLDEIVKNILAPVFSILTLLEPVISMEQIDGILEGFIGMSLTDIIEIGNNGGANLIELINGLIGGIKIYADKDYNEDGTLKEGAEPIDVINLLPANFFVELSKYAVDVTTPDNPAVGDTATAWTYDSAEALMYVLDTVFNEDYYKKPDV